jgi:ATP-dependent Lhr-like helicase
MRTEHAWVHAEGTTLLRRPDAAVEWWTFAGTRANATLAGELSRLGAGRVDHDALAITIHGAAQLATVERAVRELASRDPSAISPEIEEAALEGLKFAACLPRELAVATLASRLQDVPAIRDVLSQPLRVVSAM